MKRMASILLIFLLISSAACAQLRHTIIPESPAPGEPITIAINSGAAEALLFINDRQVSKASFIYIPGEGGNSGFMAAVITIPSTSPSGNAVIKLSNAARDIVSEIPFVIAPRTFASETIYLDPVNTGIRTDPSPERQQQANHLWQILTTTGYQYYHTGVFLPPILSTRRTSAFGGRRVFQYSTGGSDTSIHAGVDYGIPTGTRVDACGRGRVVLARMRIVTGNSVVIEHAPGIYSLYYHLDSISVEEDEIVNMGDQIGLSGSTGLSTGPHLHWEIRVNAENTDPDAFLSRPIIDKNLINSRIFSER